MIGFIKENISKEEQLILSNKTNELIESLNRELSNNTYKGINDFFHCDHEKRMRKEGIFVNIGLQNDDYVYLLIDSGNYLYKESEPATYKGGKITLNNLEETCDIVIKNLKFRTLYGLGIVMMYVQQKSSELTQSIDKIIYEE